jgi:hypothetical protein
MAGKKKNTDYKKIAKTLSKNYWTISTLILAVLLVTVLISGGISGATIGAETAGQKVLDFANNQGANAELISAIDDGALYEVILSIDGQEVPVYVTKDGTNLVPSLIPLEATTPSTNTPSQTTPTPTVTKSDKPVVEAFVMSHCPYGTQIEKGLIPVMKLLGDKIDAEIKFVYYAMHPSSGEVEEQLNQYCIQEEQNDKFIPYLECFLEAGDGESCLASTGIDTTKLETCTTATDAEFNVLANLNDQSTWMNGRFPKFDIHKAENDAYDVGGSPTLVINGAQVRAGRDSQSLLNAICAAFNVAPEECNTDLSSLGTPAPGFGFGTQGGATAAGCGV